MNSQIDGKIYNVSIQANVIQASTAVKFPCLFYILWKTHDQKSTVQSGRCAPHAQKVTFNETLTLSTTLIYERSRKSFLKKQTQLQLNLISKSRPDQHKLVGRVTVDLAQLLNNPPNTQPKQYPLQFCSVNATLLASFKVLEKIETDLSQYQLEKSFGEGMSFSSALKGLAPQSVMDKSRDSMAFASPANGKAFQVMTHKKQYSVVSSQSKNRDSGVFKDIVKQTKETHSTIKDVKQIFDDKNKAKSFKTPKSDQVQSNNSRKVGSILSQQTKPNDQSFKLKLQIDQLKLQNSKKAQQEQKARLQLQKKLKDIQFVKLQVRQKQSLLDQSTTELNITRNQSNRLRQQAAKARDQAANSTIKLAELRDSFNRVSLQLSTAERQIKRYENMNQNLQQSNQTKRQQANQISQLSKQISELQIKYNRITKEKIEQDEYMKIKQTEYRKKYDDWNHQRSTQTSNKETLLIQLSSAQEQLRNETIIRLEQQSRLKLLQVEVNRLTALQHQFQQAKHSWDISQGILNEQVSRKGARLTELQETLITLGERVRWLQGENQLLSQNGRHGREQYLKLQQQKRNQRSVHDGQLQKLSQKCTQINRNYQALLQQKTQLENILGTLNQQYQSLSADQQKLSQQYSFLVEKNSELTSIYINEKKKSSELQQLVLSGNQQRQRELREAATRQKDLQIRIIQLQNELQTMRDQIIIYQQRALMLDQQLQSRQNLIVKFQDGLRVQIQRSQSLNAKLLNYMEKDDRIKDIYLIMEEEQRRLHELIIQQESSQNRNREVLRQKQNQIIQLVRQLEVSINYGKSLEGVLSSKQHQFRGQSQALNNQINYYLKKIGQIQAALYESRDQSVYLSNKLAQNQQVYSQKAAQYDRCFGELNGVIQTLNNQKSQLSSIIINLEANINTLNNAIAQKQGQIATLLQKCNALGEQILQKQLRESESKDKLIEFQLKVADSQINISELQNQILLKQQIIQQQANRYNELQIMYDGLSSDIAAFDIIKHKQDLKQSNQTISTLQAQIKRLQAQVAKIPSIQRSLKIKVIELNSMKFKGKGQAPQSNELVRLKDEQIASLIAQKQKLLSIQQEFLKLQEQVAALQGELQLVQEERFNIQSESNERALFLDEAREENRKLMEQITIIGQRNSDLQKMFAEMISNEPGQRNIKLQASLKAQNLILKNQLKESQGLKSKVYQLEQTRKKLLQQLQTKEKGSNQQNKLSNQLTSKTSPTKNDGIKNSSNNKNNNQLKNNLNINETCKSLKSVLQQRVRGKLQDKIIQLIDKLYSKQGSKDSSIIQKVKTLSKDFAKLKVQLMKAGQAKTSIEKGKLLSQLQTFQNTISTIVTLFE